MFGGRDSGLSDLFEQLPGRPWWWGVGLGLLLLLVFFGIFHNVGRPARRLPRPGDNFSDDNPLPPKKPVAQTKKPSPPPVRTASPAGTASDVAGAAEQPGNGAAKESQPPSTLAASGVPPATVPAATVAVLTQPAPAELSQWNDGDFIRAWELRDSRLTSAIQQRAKNPERTADEAEMLETLLRPSPPARPAGAATDKPLLGRPQAPSPVMLRVVAVALGANNTAAARQTLARLLAGGFPGVDGSAIAEDTVAALLQQGSPESEQIVLRHLVAPPAADPQQEKGSPCAGRHDQVMAPVRAYASARLRRLLAEALIDGTAPAAGRQVLVSLLCEPKPLNLEAQVLLYQSEAVDTAMRVALAKQFVAASTEAMQTLLGLATRKPGAVPPTPDRCCQIGGQLWGPPLTNFLIVQYRGLRALADDPGAVGLAATIPNDALRVNFRRILKRHWSEGPQILPRGGRAGRHPRRARAAGGAEIVGPGESARQGRIGQGRGGKAYDYPRPWQRPRRRCAAAERRGGQSDAQTAPGTS